MCIRDSDGGGLDDGGLDVVCGGENLKLRIDICSFDVVDLYVGGLYGSQILLS